tara:strand:- start:1930 stop:2121 length:192 start_codon:yes stop_codon:yes gene_type:complete
LSFIQLQLIFQEWADKAAQEFGTSLFQKELAEWVQNDADMEDQAICAKFAYEALQMKRSNGLL